MQKFYESLLDRFHELHLDILKTLEEMPAEALDWKPGPEMNSLAVLVIHVAGAERYWIGDVARQDPSDRDRDAEFKVSGLNSKILIQRISDLETYERMAFGDMALSDLDEERISPRDGWKYSVAWALSHALEHTAIHVGHIQMLSQLWKQGKREMNQQR